MTPLAKAKARLDAVGKAAIGDMHALRAELSAAQATAAGAAYGQIASGLDLRRGLHQRHMVGAELGAPSGRLVEYHPPQVPIGRIKEGPALNWRLLFGRGLLT